VLQHEHGCASERYAVRAVCLGLAPWDTEKRKRGPVLSFLLVWAPLREFIHCASIPYCSSLPCNVRRPRSEGTKKDTKAHESQTTGKSSRGLLEELERSMIHSGGWPSDAASFIPPSPPLVCFYPPKFSCRVRSVGGVRTPLTCPTQRSPYGKRTHGRILCSKYWSL